MAVASQSLLSSTFLTPTRVPLFRQSSSRRAHLLDSQNKSPNLSLKQVSAVWPFGTPHPHNVSTAIPTPPPPPHVLASSAETMTSASPLPEGATQEDARYMRRAVELAQRAVGKTSPNPIVGCVIVKDGQIIGEGFHPKAGEPHAEVFALREAGKEAEGATAYVTLEPCNHFGRTPPCSQALVKARVGRVVVGSVDPNPLVGGQGVKTLLKAGIEVVVGVEEEMCKRNVEAFMWRIVNKRPFATLRYSMSLDGRLLTTPPEVEQGSHYSKMLAENDAVVITDAALLDNPGLTLLSKEPDCKQPLRVLVAFNLAALDQSCAIFDTSAAPLLVVASAKTLTEDVQRSATTGNPTAETWLREKGAEVVIIGGDEDDLNPTEILDLLYQRNACAVLWENQAPEGSGLENFLGKWAIDDGAVEKIVVTMPLILGGREGVNGVKAEGLFASVEGKREMKAIKAYNYPEEVVLEGYMQNA